MGRCRAWQAVLVAAALAACAPPAAPKAGPAGERCWLPGLDAPARCLHLDVPGGPHAPGQDVRLFVAVLPADRADPAKAPIYLLAGGPGQAVSEVAGAMVQALRHVRRDRDLVLVDLRGTGRSAPTGCELNTDGEDPLLDVFADRLDAARVAACRAALPLPPLAYGTAQASDDLEAVRQALGHPRIALYGVSYGTRLGLVHLARHGATVESAALDGVLAADVPLFATFAEDGEAAMALLARDCAAAAGCRARFGDVRAAVTRLLDGLATPRNVMARKVMARHPRTGVVRELPVTRQGVALAMRALLYDADVAATLPLAVSRASDGDFEPLWTATSLLVDGARRSSDPGLMLAVACAEDVPRLGSGREEAGFVGSAMVDQIRAACAAFPTPPAAPLPTAAEAAPAVPMLLLSGALDPVTPPRHAEAVRQARGGHHLVVPGVGHGAGRHGCAPRALQTFFAAPATAEPALDCGRRTERPPFVLTRAGAGP